MRVSFGGFWLSCFISINGSAWAQSSFDPYIALPTSKPKIFDYVRKNEVQVVVDMHIDRCTLILTNGEEITVYQKCAILLEDLPQVDRIKFTNLFGQVFVQPDFVFDLRSTNNSGCRLNFQNARFVAVNESCSVVHERLIKP